MVGKGSHTGYKASVDLLLGHGELEETLAGRAGIHPWAWVVNTSLAAAEPESGFLRRRAAAEAEQIAVVESLTNRVAIVPLLSEEPVGEARLAAIATTPLTVA